MKNNFAGRFELILADEQIILLANIMDFTIVIYQNFPKKKVK